MKSSLIDREVAGKLPASQSRLLHLQAMRSPSLLSEIAQARERLPAASKRGKAQFFSMHPRILALSAAAALILAFAIIRFYPASRPSGQSAAVPRTISPSPSATLPAPFTPQAIMPSPAISTAAAHPVVFFLPALHLRGDEAIPVLILPRRSIAEKTPAKIELQIEIRGPGPGVVHLRHDDSTVATLSHPPVHTAGPLHYVSIKVESSRLAPGHYSVEIASNPDVPADDARSFLVQQGP